MTAWVSARQRLSPLTIDDLSSGAAGTLVLSTPSPYFYGDIIIGNTGTPTVEVMSDAALGNTAAAEAIGEVELNGGTLQTGASFAAPERDIDVIGGSQIDLDGNTTSWGSLTDVKRTLEIGNSGATVGAITFRDLVISQTSILQLSRGPRQRNGNFHKRNQSDRRHGYARPQSLVLDGAGDDGEGVLRRCLDTACRWHCPGLDRRQRGRHQGQWPL